MCYFYTVISKQKIGSVSKLTIIHFKKNYFGKIFWVDVTHFPKNEWNDNTILYFIFWNCNNM